MHPPLDVPAAQTWQMSDGYVVHGRVWRTSASQASPILYLHGVQSHGGWFEWSASRLALHSACLMMPDRRGSGCNARDCGSGAYDQRAMADVDEHVEWLLRQTDQPRVRIVGVSWGGKLAALWAAKRPERVESLLLIAPGLFPRVTLSLGQKAGVVAAALAGGQRLHPIPLNEAALFTDNPAGQAFILRDELKLTHAGTEFMLSSRRMDQKIAHMAKGAIRAPTTLLLAGRDRIIRNASAAAWLARVCRHVPCVLELPEAAHTLEFEPDTGFFERILDEWSGAGACLRRL